MFRDFFIYFSLHTECSFSPFLTFYMYCLLREEGKVFDGISNRPSTFQPCFFFFLHSSPYYSIHKNVTTDQLQLLLCTIV